MSSTLPQSLGGYRILSELGKGAASFIYHAQDPKTRQHYALKHIPRRSSNDDRFIEQAELEHQICQQLNHPALRKTHKVIKQRKLLKITDFFVLMERVEGDTLDHRRPRTVGRLLRLIYKATEGLQAMHEKGYAHCDIKPTNIIITPDKTVKLIDFGQSCKIGHVKERIQGTPDYIAPEQVKRDPITPMTDIFNLGATMYWTLTNQFVPTMVGKDFKISTTPPPAPKPAHEINPAVPSQISHLIQQCVNTDPRDRPSSMGELQSKLLTLANQHD